MSKSMDSPFPKSLTIKQAVIATLAFFDLFEVPLTRAELSEHLFFIKPDEEKIDIYLRESPLIAFQDGYYGLQHHPIFFENFMEKQKRALQYWKKVRRMQWLFQICPFIEFVAVCNSLPISDVHERSDIDLFVVAKQGHLFTARFFLTLLTSLFGVRRHGKKVKKRFCLSFYCTEAAFDFEKIAHKAHDIYLAYWIKTLEPISGDHSVYLRFIETNRNWLSPYFQNIFPRKRYFRHPKAWQKKWKQKMEKYFATNKWEKRFENWQMKRARTKYLLLKKPNGTILNENMLKFHDTDIRESIKTQWMERMNQLL